MNVKVRGRELRGQRHIGEIRDLQNAVDGKGEGRRCVISVYVIEIGIGNIVNGQREGGGNHTADQGEREDRNNECFDKLLLHYEKRSFP